MGSATVIPMRRDVIPQELYDLVFECACGTVALHIISVDSNNRQTLHVFDNRRTNLSQKHAQHP